MVRRREGDESQNERETGEDAQQRDRFALSLFLLRPSCQQRSSSPRSEREGKDDDDEEEARIRRGGGGGRKKEEADLCSSPPQTLVQAINQAKKVRKYEPQEKKRKSWSRVHALLSTLMVLLVFIHSFILLLAPPLSLLWLLSFFFFLLFSLRWSV